MKDKCCNLNRVIMSPQPLLELNQVSSDSMGRWGRLERGKGVVELLLNPHPLAEGVQKENGIWYWLIND